MTVFRGWRGTIDKPISAAEKYRAEYNSRRGERKPAYYCGNGCLTEEGYVTRINKAQYEGQQGLCDDCYAEKRAANKRAFSGRKHDAPVRLLPEIHSQLTGRTSGVVRCGECRLPAEHCKCSAPIERPREGRGWY